MSRYRKVDPRIWGDEKFRRLSRDARYLFLHLLTGPHTTRLPGLWAVGAQGLAEAAGMTGREFAAAWSAIEAAGMARADWDARVVCLPNALRYHHPESPNVVRGWAKELDEVPECDLKRTYMASIQSFLKTFGKPYGHAFARVDGNLSRTLAESGAVAVAVAVAGAGKDQHPWSPDGDRVSSPPDNGGQPQSPLILTATPHPITPQDRADKPPKAPPGEVIPSPPGFEEFWVAWPKRVGKGDAKKAWKQMRLGAVELPLILAAIQRRRTSEQWTKDGGKFIPHPATWLRREGWLDEPTKWCDDGS